MSKSILAIDPGPEECGLAMLNADGSLAWACVEGTSEVVARLAADREWDGVAIEKLGCYGMPVGEEVFQTAYAIGRMLERCEEWALTVQMIPRMKVKLHLCKSPKAKDANIRQAIIDRYGGKDKAIGNKKNPGPLYGVKSHCWAALALAITAQETEASGG